MTLCQRDSVPCHDSVRALRDSVRGVRGIVS